jgi:hypothetical protein
MYEARKGRLKPINMVLLLWSNDAQTMPKTDAADGRLPDKNNAANASYDRSKAGEWYLCHRPVSNMRRLKGATGAIDHRIAISRRECGRYNTFSAAG